MDIYTSCIREIAIGKSFNISFENRSLRVDGRYIIKDGKVLHKKDKAPRPLTETDIPDGFTLDDAINDIEDLYYRYYHSRPSERSENARGLYFRAPGLDEVSHDDFMWGDNREICRFNLEFRFLYYLIKGVLKWEGALADAGTWFWRSGHLVILRRWIESEVR